MILAGDFLAIKKGRNPYVRATRLEKLRSVSLKKAARSSFEGWVKSITVLMPAFNQIASRSG